MHAMAVALLVPLDMFWPSLSDTWDESLNIPFIAAFASALIFVVTLSVNRSSVKTHVSERAGERQKFTRHIEEHGGKTVIAFKTTRLLCASALLALTAHQIISKPPTEDGNASWLATYTFLLTLLSVGTRERVRSLAANHLTVILLVVWGVYVYRDVWPFATFTLTPKDSAEGVLLWAKVALLTISAVVVPLCIPRPYVPINPEESMVATPEQTASVLTLILYAWVDNAVWKAFRQGYAKLDDLPPLADYDHAKNLVKRGLPHLDPFQTPKRRHFFWGLTHIFWREYIVLALMLALRSILPLAGPLGVNRLLNYLEHGGEGMIVRPWVWVLLLFLGPTATALALQWYIYTVTTGSVRMKAIITQLVFEHALRIRMKAETVTTKPMPSTSDVSSPAEPTIGEHHTVVPVIEGEMGEETVLREPDTTPTAVLEGESMPQESSGGAPNLVGQISNLVTTDLQMLENGRDFIALLVEVPTTLAFSTWFLYAVLGWSAFVGMAVMAALLPLPGYIASFIHGLQVKKMAMTDARVQTVTEMLGVVRMIKLFGWEPRVVDEVAAKRREELRYVRQVRMRQFLMNYENYLIPVVTMIVTYATYTIVMKKTLSASTLFSSITLFETLRNQIQMTFGLVPMMIQAKVSTDRFDEFLHETELLDGFSDTANHSADPLADHDNIGMRNATFTWSTSDEVDLSGRVFRLLVEDELTFKRGRVNLVLGPTGSGKTSILMALLGEMHYVPIGPGSYVNLPRSGGVAYAAQESWIQNETIKDNILFGSPFDAERYDKVIDQCGLRRDLDLLDARDLTEVGEKGLTLSGGQKARITLARAIYSTAEILLLDDVLAALDVHTSQWVVKKCFKGDLVRGRTLILVTHNVAAVRPIADFVVALGADGRIHSQGSLFKALEADEYLASQFTEQMQDDKAEASTEGPSDETTKLERKGKLIVKEEVSSGQVSWPAFKLFLGSLGGQHPVIFWATCLGMYSACEIMSTLQVWFLGLWTRQYDLMPSEKVPVAVYITVYSLGQGLVVILLSTSYLIYVLGALRASKVIHSKLMLSVFGTTLRWLDMTPASGIITRCTQDIQAVDNQFVDWCFSWMQHSGMVATKLGAVVIMSPLMLIPGSTVFILGALCGYLYINAQLSAKREMGIAQGPVLGNFGAAIAGLVSIRAYGAQEMFRQESYARIDKLTRAARSFNVLNQWMGSRVDTLAALFTAGVGAYMVYGPPRDPPSIGFSLNMAVQFSSLIIWWIKYTNALQVGGNNLERVLQYLSIEQEPKATTDGVPPAYWPASGALRVEKLSARYSADGPRVLHDISFEVKPGERVGIVGRTGSGKSSLTLALLRCILTEGKVYYDDIATDTLNLDSLRSKITIIPQSPELLSGTLRENLDPFQEHDDATLNDALRAAGLFSLQRKTDEGKITLDSQIASGGGNLSVGQRQILALARAIVRQSKLLILDEATSAIDYETDSVIQTSLRDELKKDVTLLTIAHRLQTIMDNDKIMVLDAGHIVEYGPPSELLGDENGFLRALVNESADKEHLLSAISVKASSSVSSHV